MALQFAGASQVRLKSLLLNTAPKLPKRLLPIAQLAEDLIEVGVGTSLLPCCYQHELYMRFAY